jgi:hypothetical protein
MILPEHSKALLNTIHLDFGEVAKKSDMTKKTKSFLVVVDEASRLIQAKAMRENSKSVIEYLENHPFLKELKTIITDCGTAFTSKDFKNWALCRGITLKTTAPYYFAANGLTERKIRDVKAFVSLYPNFRGGWKCALEAAVKHINRLYNRAIGCSPFFKAFNRSSPLKADQEFNLAVNVKERPFTEKQQMEYRLRMQEYFNRTHCNKFPTFEVGTDILVQTGIKGKNIIISGPFKIVEVRRLNGMPKTIIYEDSKGHHKVASIGSVQLYHQRSDDIPKKGDL